MFPHRNFNLISASFLLLVTACQTDSGQTQVVETEQVRGTMGAPMLMDGHLIQEGRFTAMLPGRPSRDFTVSITNTLARGDGDAVMQLTDETDGSQTVLTLDDEQAHGALQTPDGDILGVTFNADETLSFDGADFDTPEEAAEQIFTSEAAADVTPESLAVASAMLEASSEMADTATDRGKVVKSIGDLLKKLFDRGVVIIIKGPLP